MALLVKIEDIYLNPQQIEAITLEDSIFIRGMSGKLYVFPNTSEILSILRDNDIISWEA